MTSLLLLTLMWLSFAALARHEARRRSPALLFVLGGALVAGLPCTVYLVGDSFADEGEVLKAVFFITAFNGLFLLTRELLPPHRVISETEAPQNRRISRSERRLILLVYGLFASAFVLKLYGADFSFSVLAGRTWREGGGLADLLVAYAAHASFGLVLCLLYLRKNVQAGICFVAVVVLVVIDRSRALVLASLAPVILLVLVRARARRVRIRTLVATTGLGGAAAVGFFTLQQIRYLGELSTISSVELSKVVGAAVNRMMGMEGDLSLARGMIWLMNHGEVVEGYGKAWTLQRMLLFWAPREFKPPEFTQSIAAAYWNSYTEGGSFHPTIYGVAWGDAEWVGLAYAVLMALVFWVFDRIVIRYAHHVVWTILLGPYCMFAVLVARGSVQNGWVAMIVATTLLLVMTRVAGLRWGSASRGPGVGLTTEGAKRGGSPPYTERASGLGPRPHSPR